jgi:SanA protein
MKKATKIFLYAIGIILLMCIVVMMVCNQIVVNNAEGKVFSDIDSIKYNKVGLLLGTTPQARIGRITNAFFTYSIDAAEELYKAGKRNRK